MTTLVCIEADSYMQEVMRSVRKASPDVGYLAKRSLLSDKSKIEREDLPKTDLSYRENLFE